MPESNEPYLADIPPVAEVAPKPKGFHFIDMADLVADIVPPDWLLGGWLEKNSIAQIVGKPNAGKSLQALDWGLCVATGTTWRNIPVDQTAVAYICGEGHNGMRRRIKAWSMYNQVDLAGVPFTMSSQAAHLDDDEVALQVFAELERIQPGFIIIDTLARNMGGNENDTKDMSQFVKNVDELLRAPFKAAVLIVHHTGHADRDTGRGSTVLIGAIDNNYKVTNANGQATLKATKIRDGEYPADVVQDIRAIEMDGHDKFGNPFTAPVLVSGNAGPAPQGPQGKYQKQAYTLLQALSKKYGIDTEPDEPVWIPLERWRQKMIDTGAARQRWYDASKGLAERKLIVMNQHHARLI